MTKKFTTLELFCITDGRIATNMDDVYRILNHVFGSDITTVGLLGCFDVLKDKNPKWFREQIERLNRIKSYLRSDEFTIIVEAIEKDFNEEVDVPQLKDGLEA